MAAVSTARISLVADIVLLAPVVWHLASISWIFVSRISYPMDIEWMEGGALLHAYRFMHGLPIYGPPSQGFLPFPYPPLHFAVMAGAGTVAGLDYWAGRAVSILFFAIACAVVFREVRVSAGRGREGLLLAAFAVALAVSSFPTVGGWYDLIRNDSMALAFPLLAASALSDTALTRFRLIAGAVMFTAAVFTKQTAIFFIAWTCLFLFVRNFRDGLRFALFTGSLCTTALAIMLAATSGYFWLHVFGVMSSHRVSGRRALEGVLLLIQFAPYLLALPIVAAFAMWKGWLRSRTVLWLGMLTAAGPAALLPYAKIAGYLNNLIPVAFLAGPVFILTMNDVIRGLSPRPRWCAAARWVTVAVASGLLVLHAYEPRTYIPTADMWEKATALNDVVASLPNGVVIPGHPFLPARNGDSTPQFHEMAYNDALNAGVEGLDLPGYLRRGHAEWAILSEVENANVRGWIYQVYEPTNRVPLTTTGGELVDTVAPITGFRSSPRHLLRARRPLNRVRAHAVFAHSTEWMTTGNAFDPGGPLKDATVIDTFHPTLYDKATGTAVSSTFTIDRAYIGFLIGGGRGPGTRVELRVDGQVVRSATGIISDIPTEVVWDVRAITGRDATMTIVDWETTSSYGHISVREVELFDVDQ